MLEDAFFGTKSFPGVYHANILSGYIALRWLKIKIGKNHACLGQ
jgi:hypothetical protein